MKTIIDFDGKPVDTYTKDEVIDILEELDNKIMEVYIDHMEVDWHEIIQQKINSLKEDTGAK